MVLRSGPSYPGIEIECPESATSRPYKFPSQVPRAVGMTGAMSGKTSDDGAAAPALEGAGAVAATRPPAQRTAVRADRTAQVISYDTLQLSPQLAPNRPGD